MGQTTLRQLYDMHSWIGVILGAALYVVCFSGVVALFTEELGPWSRRDSAMAGDPAAAAARALTALEQAGAFPPSASFTILLPTRYDPAITVLTTGDSASEYANRRLDPDSLAPLPVDRGTANRILTRLHTDLLLPEPVGRYLVGALGIVMLISIGSGILLHRKMLTELFTLRTWRSLRLFWTDMHKSVGLWGLPFHAMIALTGAVLGFAGFAVALIATVAFQGDVESAFRALVPSAQAGPTGSPAAMLPMAELLATARAALPGLEPEVLSFENYGKAGGSLTAMGNLPGRLVYYPSVTVAGATGDVVAVTDWSRAGLGRRIYAMVTPLHYASFGGIAVKLLYAVLGAGTCLTIVSGFRVWLSRAGPGRDPGGAERLATGVVCGLPLATVALFCATRLTFQHAPQGETEMTGLFLALCSAGIAWPWLRGAAAGRDMLALTGGMLTAQPLLGYLSSGRQPLDGFGGGMPAAAELSGFVLGGLVLALVLRRDQGRRGPD